MKKRLITSALPYVNNIPHLGNLIQVLSADVFARFCRLRGYDTRYICGTDEYGTATETKALEEKVDPATLCNRYFAIHQSIYQWFDISFDYFGRTSAPVHTEITQQIFLRLYEQGYVKAKKDTQLYSTASQMFLADRFIRGRCPHCDYPDARGDQCEHCGTLLDPMDLIEPSSIIDDSVPEPRETEHLYVDLPKLQQILAPWVQTQAKNGRWSKNAVKMTQAWIRDGLKERAITRDLKWGIPVPLDNYRNKVFYVWFDAPIGYISITADKFSDWEAWWKEEGVQLFQFVGKDNIPFHSVLFPAVLLGTKDPWNLVYHISSSEYLNYEGGSFSKSRNFGIFGDQVQETGIPSDVWRFYLMYHRPESSDYNFSWEGFQSTINTQLIGNFANLVHRTLSFCHQYFPGPLAQSDLQSDFWQPVRQHIHTITECMEHAKESATMREIMLLCSYANRCFQNAEPWKQRNSDPEAVRTLLSQLVHLIHDICILISPFIPRTAEKVCSFLGRPAIPSWDQLNSQQSFPHLKKPTVLFRFLEDDRIVELKARYSGGSRREENPSDVFSRQVRLSAARITEVSAHPNADRLYVIQLDDGSGIERQIVSGLVGHYTPEELEGKTIILVANLKPAKLRKVRSNGMLLAAQKDDTLELLLLENAEPGSPVHVQGRQISKDSCIISIDEFLTIPITVENKVVKVAGENLVCKGISVCTTEVLDGRVS